MDLRKTTVRPPSPPRTGCTMSIKHFFLLSLCCAGLTGCATRETAADRLVVEPRGTQERVTTEKKPFVWPDWAPNVGR